MDPITIGLLAGAGLGMLKGQKNLKKDIQDAQTRKAIINYSPWTHMQDPGMKDREDALEAMVSGGATGAMMGGMVKGSMMGKTGMSPEMAANQQAATMGAVDNSFANNPYWQQEQYQMGGVRNPKWGLLR